MSSVKYLRHAILAGSAVAGMVLCGSAHADQISAKGGHTVDAGLEKPVTVPAATKLKVAFFIGTVTNIYTQAMVDEARKWGVENDVEVEVFDAQYNSQNQLDQLENVLQNRDFNGWLVNPLDGNLSCSVVTKDAPAKNILVVVSNISICGRDAESASGQWAPGILAYVGAEETRDYVNAWAKKVVADRQGQPTKAIVLYGAPGITLTRNMEAAIAAVTSKDFEVVGSATTDFTAASGQAKMDTLLQAHPDANVLLSAYSDITSGALNSIEDQDRQGKIAVYDFGAGESTLPLIKSGAIRASAVFSPRSHVRVSLDVLREAWVNGTTPERYLDGLSYGTTTEPFLVKTETLDGYKPEF